VLRNLISSALRSRPTTGSRGAGGGVGGAGGPVGGLGGGRRSAGGGTGASVGRGLLSRLTRGR